MKTTKISTTILSAFVTMSLGACAIDQADDAADDDYTNEGRLAANGMTPANLYALGMLPSDPLTTTQLETWATTTDGQVVTPYLITCAFSTAQSFTFDNNGTPITLYGSLGLATGWTTTALTTQQQELLSGCLLARLNESGSKVTVSLHGAVAGYSYESGEELGYPYQEGAYFGNLFIPSYKHYSCRGSAYANAPGSRVCQLSGHCGVTWSGTCSSVCGFADGHMTSCQSALINGTTYANPTTVYDHI